MLAPEVEEFAKLLMQYVRDEAITSCDMLRRPDCNSLVAKRWHQKMQSGRVDELLTEAISDCVDRTLFYLLYAIDEGLLQLSFKSSSGKVVDLSSDGKSVMSGWCAGGGQEDWRARFSKMTFNDDLKDLE